MRKTYWIPRYKLSKPLIFSFVNFGRINFYFENIIKSHGFKDIFVILDSFIGINFDIAVFLIRLKKSTKISTPLLADLFFVFLWNTIRGFLFYTHVGSVNLLLKCLMPNIRSHYINFMIDFPWGVSPQTLKS